MEASPSNKYLSDLEEAIAEDAYLLIKVFELVIKITKLVEPANLSGEAKYMALKRLKKFVQDLYAAVPNQYRVRVESLVQEALFPEIEKEMNERTNKMSQDAIDAVNKVLADNLPQSAGPPEALPAVQSDPDAFVVKVEGGTLTKEVIEDFVQKVQA